MEDDLTRAQHYRDLASQMIRTAQGERDATIKDEFLKLSEQYARLAERLLEAHLKRPSGDADSTR